MEIPESDPQSAFQRLQFPNAVVLKRGRMQKHAQERKRAQMRAQERKRKYSKERKSSSSGGSQAGGKASIGSPPLKNQGKSRGPPAEPRRASQNPRRDPRRALRETRAEPSESLVIGNGVGKQGRGNQPPYRRYGPVSRNSVSGPYRHTDWQKQAEFSPKEKPIRNFSIDLTSSIRTPIPKGPKIEKIQDRPPGLKFSIEIENFNRD